MSIKIYSGYDEFKYEEPDITDCIDIENPEELDEESDDIFFSEYKKSNFIDSSSFYVLADLEDEENAEDISGYLGKYKRIYIPESHKVLFLVI